MTVAYGLTGFVNVPSVPIVAAVAPNSTNYKNVTIGQLWVNQSSGAIYGLASLSGNSATWVTLGSSSGTVDTVLGTANQITATTVGNTATISLPSAIIAPGSLATTTTLTAGTGLTVTAGGAAITGTTTINTSGAAVTTIGTGGTGAVNIGNATGNTAVTGSLTASTTLTATLGNITATNGNLVAATSGTGVSLPVVTASGAASGTVNCNGRVGSVTFTGVSIAAAADLTLTMGNTSITGASTRIVWSMSGATTGCALSVKSYTPSANQVVWVVTNGTGATTSTANITFDFIVLN